MIAVKLIGGLGNQLFQYALGKKLALKFHTELCFDTGSYKDNKSRKYALGAFRFPQRLVTNGELKLFGKREEHGFLEKAWFKIARGLSGPVVINEQHFHFDPTVLTEARRCSYLDGYWQSEKYFSDIRKELLVDIVPKQGLAGKNLELAEHIRSVNSVSLHVRRGDYVSDSRTADIHGVCDVDYYQRAIEHVTTRTKDTVLFIFSDDMNWVKASLNTSQPTHYVDHNGVDHAHEDIRLISMCKHNIIANSSFSWWGAWLNTNSGRIVVAPKRWFKVNDHNTSDVYPVDFVKL